MTEKRNAHVQQDRHEADKKTRTQFDGIGLTKRNSDYMFRFSKELKKTALSPERKAEIISQMKDELLVEQKHGATARNLYGTVEERIAFIVNPPKKKTSMFDNFIPNVVYNAVFFLILFNLMYGFILLIQPKNGQEQAVGITSLILISAVFGFCAPFLTKLLDPSVKHTYNGWMRALFMLITVLVWILAFFIAINLPKTGINVVVSPIVNFVLAAIGIGVDIWVHKKYTITVNFFTPRVKK
ncbi:DUF1129 family protein [Apilactobacillus apinorum]|uniref:DUF1129 domain-containing protein n=1 Tax=Apilactobacillus apinorum TaxID=1218495 RepID=A0ABP9ZGB8_9LACO|nr:DUF1129 family protein [Apilactobacillus apinorum]KOY69739.1 Uncharacterized protein RZ74_02410 [Apilactobacillus apinorum]CAI2626159.1 hypothetical protein AAPFHON13_02470 [Apilactobacillus apinorum]